MWHFTMLDDLLFLFLRLLGSLLPARISSPARKSMAGADLLPARKSIARSVIACSEVYCLLGSLLPARISSPARKSSACSDSFARSEVYCLLGSIASSEVYGLLGSLLPARILPARKSIACSEVYCLLGSLLPARISSPASKTDAISRCKIEISWSLTNERSAFMRWCIWAVDGFRRPVDAFHYLWTFSSLPVDAFHYLWTFFSLPVDAFHYLWTLFHYLWVVFERLWAALGRDGLPRWRTWWFPGSLAENVKLWAAFGQDGLARWSIWWLFVGLVERWEPYEDKDGASGCSPLTRPTLELLAVVLWRAPLYKNLFTPNLKFQAHPCVSLGRLYGWI
jgi:hypothetical protein